MSAEFGRISGPLLASNLLRDGVDLAFETTLLYIDVTNGRIGVKSDTPTKDLFVNNTIKTTNLIVDTQATIANFTINTNNIRNLTNSIYIRPNQTSSPQIYAVKYATSNLEFSSNLIKNTVTNSDINISPVTGGETNIRNSIEIFGNLNATGNITWDGDITLGNDSTDNIVFSADVNSNVIPNNPGSVESYDLGSPSQRWNITYSNIVNSSYFYPDLASIGTLTAGNIRISGNTITNSVIGNPINLSPNGTGVALFNGTQYIDGSNILTPANEPFTLSYTTTGYIKFAGTNGLAIPAGTTEERPETIELGAVRFNTTLKYAEIYVAYTDPLTNITTNIWMPVRGIASELSVEEVTEIMDIWTLILG